MVANQNMLLISPIMTLPVSMAQHKAHKIIRFFITLTIHAEIGRLKRSVFARNAKFSCSCMHFIYMRVLHKHVWHPTFLFFQD